jgi:hypothetical protein
MVNFAFCLACGDIPVQQLASNGAKRLEYLPSHPPPPYETTRDESTAGDSQVTRPLYHSRTRTRLGTLVPCHVRPDHTPYFYTYAHLDLLPLFGLSLWHDVKGPVIYCVFCCVDYEYRAPSHRVCLSYMTYKIPCLAFRTLLVCCQHFASVSMYQVVQVVCADMYRTVT